MTQSVCVADFGGSYSARGYSIYPFNYWADYFPAEQVTKFGGRWADVPDMPCQNEPTEDALEAWAREHGGFYFTPEEQETLKLCRS